MLKAEPASSYPPEDGRYLRGNDYSPVAVVVILNYDQEKIPPDIEDLVRVGLESGAALSGTIQTENIGIEKLICNIVANPNIRYLVIFGPESPGHQTGDALLMLVENGVDERKRIIGAQALTPYLFNLPMEYIAAFANKSVRLISWTKGNPNCCAGQSSLAFKRSRHHSETIPSAIREPTLKALCPVSSLGGSRALRRSPKTKGSGSKGRG